MRTAYVFDPNSPNRGKVIVKFHRDRPENIGYPLARSIKLIVYFPLICHGFSLLCLNTILLGLLACFKGVTKFTQDNLPRLNRPF